MFKLVSAVAGLSLLIALGAAGPARAADAELAPRVLKKPKKLAPRYVYVYRSIAPRRVVVREMVRPVYVPLYRTRYRTVVRQRYFRPPYFYGPRFAARPYPYWRYRFERPLLRPYSYGYARPYWRRYAYDYGYGRPYYRSYSYVRPVWSHFYW